jgi:hypothetical protein
VVGSLNPTWLFSARFLALFLTARLKAAGTTKERGKTEKK